MTADRIHPSCTEADHDDTVSERTPNPSAMGDQYQSFRDVPVTVLFVTWYVRQIALVRTADSAEGNYHKDFEQKPKAILAVPAPVF
jgi:hypothetical protein